jgi:hypothetical protein
MKRNGSRAAAPEGLINRWDLGHLSLAKAGFSRSITHYANQGSYYNSKSSSPTTQMTFPTGPSFFVGNAFFIR